MIDNKSDNLIDEGKCLFVCIQPFDGVCNGGGAADKRCQDLAKLCLGDNFDYYYVNQKGYNVDKISRSAGFVYGLMGYIDGLTPSVINKIVKLSHDYNCVFICTSLYGVLAKRLREGGYKGRIIVHFHNVEVDYFDIIMPANFPFRKRKLAMVSQNERYACKYADKIMLLNERDANSLLKHYGRKADVVMNLSMEDKLSYCKIDDTTLTRRVPYCLFIGSYFAPNIRGVLWFVENVMPKIDVTLTIVGREMYKLKDKLPVDPRIKVESDVIDLKGLYTDADFLVMPIFEGSGMKVKTCEALMYGKNILATDEALEGYCVDAHRIGERCNTAEQFIEALQGYANRPISRFNTYSREYFLSRHTNEAALHLFRQLFE